MPYRKNQFADGEIYHLIFRGIDDNVIFKDKDDYYRMIFSIYELNNRFSTTIRDRRKAIAAFKKNRDRDSVVADKRDKLVEILSFCFMPNHIHLLARQLKENGVTKFMTKIGIGYAGYFNRKYQRKGYVFQNRFKDVHIKDDAQLRTIFNYIHANPISLIEPGWKEQGIKNTQKAHEFIENYKWSSYQDFIGGQNFPSVTDRNFLLEFIGGPKGCKEALTNRIDFKQAKNRDRDSVFSVLA